LRSSRFRFAVFSTIPLVLLIIITCGIPDYQFYLYPPDPFSPPQVGFSHDPSNDPDVFVGYDIYYKFYTEDPDSGIAESEKNSYFNSTAAFTSVSYHNVGSSVSSFTKGFRKMLIDSDTGTGTSFNKNIPYQLAIDSSERDDDFSVAFIKDDLNDIISLSLENYLGGSISFDCYRIADDGSGSYKSFLPFNDTIYETVNDTDLENFITIDFLSSFYVAFFVVPYGRDSNGVDIFSNSSSDDIIYIGSFDIN